MQVQLSLNGFMGGPNGELDWMTWNWDDQIKADVDALTDSCDTILLGRKMAGPFIDHWANVPAGHEEHPFAQKMIGHHKVVFSKTLGASQWPNTVIAQGDLAEEVNRLKAQDGRDLIVYGGADFAASLVEAGLIDELYCFMNPVLVDKGLSMFSKLTSVRQLELQKATAYTCGIVLLQYKPKA